MLTDGFGELVAEHDKSAERDFIREYALWLYRGPDY